MALSLLLVDDHQIVREGIWALLKTESEFRLAGEAADGLEAVRMAERLQPDVLVLDLMLPGLNGLDAAQQIGRRSPRTRTVILSMHSDEAYVCAALQAGATAYVLKDSGAGELVHAIRAVAAGERYFSASISETALSAYRRRSEETPVDPYHKLTFREREVLQLTAEGHTGNAIAERLFISPRTVETHRTNLMRKLGLRNQKELIRYAVRRGLVSS